MNTIIGLLVSAAVVVGVLWMFWPREDKNKPPIPTALRDDGEEVRFDPPRNRRD